MKKCSKCGTIKPIDEYYTHPKMADGHLNHCKQCVKDRMSIYWYANAQRLRESERERSKKRNSDEHYKEQRRLATRRFRADGKGVAHNLVKKKLSRTRPTRCSICGSDGRIEGHHEDYQ